MYLPSSTVAPFLSLAVNVPDSQARSPDMPDSRCGLRAIVIPAAFAPAVSLVKNSCIAACPRTCGTPGGLTAAFSLYSAVSPAASAALYALPHASLTASTAARSAAVSAAGADALHETSSAHHARTPAFLNTFIGTAPLQPVVLERADASTACHAVAQAEPERIVPNPKAKSRKFHKAASVVRIHSRAAEEI